MRPAGSNSRPQPYFFGSGEERRQAWGLAKNAARSASTSGPGAS